MPRQRTSGLDFEALHRLHMQNYERLITKAYDRAIYEAVAIAITLPKGKPSEELFSFDNHPASKKRVEAMMSGLQGRMQGIIEQGMRAEWTLANNKTDALVKRVFGKKLNDEAKHRLLSNNEDAREAFIQRKEKGLGLSDRVWRYTEQFKSEIEMGLDIGIRGGKSADELSRALRGFLREPNKLFRRVRDEHGQLKLSARAKAYHPGQGVYRSSYKNALRLAVTETNIAYRTADHERQKALDFVVGIEVHLSGNHTLNGKPFKCMCDDLVGKYPKDFKFTGWHPHCRCYTTPILKTPEEMARDTQKLLRGEPVDGHSVNEVKDLPQGFKMWMRENKSRIEGAKTLPYFIKDNPQWIGAAESIKPQDVQIAFSMTEDTARHLDNSGANKFNVLEFKQEVSDILSKHSVEIEYASLYAMDDGSWGFKLRGTGGKFFLERDFTEVGSGEIECHHSFFSLDEGLQKRGISRDIMRALYMRYQHLGVRYITLTANKGIGGYAWAKYAFSAIDKDEAIKAVLDKPGAKEALSVIDRYYQDNLLKASAPFPMNKLLVLPQAKLLLLGSYWEGVLDLFDEEQVKGFKKYLGLR